MDLVQMRYALGNSFNIPAVKMLELNGVNAMVATASAMGITTFTDPQRLRTVFNFRWGGSKNG